MADLIALALGTIATLVILVLYVRHTIKPAEPYTYPDDQDGGKPKITPLKPPTPSEVSRAKTESFIIRGRMVEFDTAEPGDLWQFPNNFR